MQICTQKLFQHNWVADRQKQPNHPYMLRTKEQAKHDCNRVHFRAQLWQTNTTKKGSLIEPWDPTQSHISAFDYNSKPYALTTRRNKDAHQAAHIDNDSKTQWSRHRYLPRFNHLVGPNKRALWHIQNHSIYRANSCSDKPLGKKTMYGQWKKKRVKPRERN